MTTTAYVTSLTSGKLTLIKENPTINDESTLTVNQYFVLMLYTDNASYHRNYVQYKNLHNYNPRYKTYDIDIYKQETEYGWYITKYYSKLFNPDRGRIIIVSVDNLSTCVNMDETSDKCRNISVIAQEITNVSQTSFTVNWECNKRNIDGFYIDVSTNQSFTSFVTGYNNKNVGKVYTTIITGLTLKSIYYVRIKAFKNKYISSPSNIVYTTTLSQIKFGLLYNWYTYINVHGLAPEGWHIPSRSEFETLLGYAGNDIHSYIIKNALYWNLYADAINNTGFTAYGAGYRDLTNPSYDFLGIKQLIYFGSTTVGELITLQSGLVLVNYSYPPSYIAIASAIKKYAGISIRCIRNTNNGWTPEEQIMDYDNNSYNTVQIGTQIWTVQNLSVTHFKDGLLIPEITDKTTWRNLTTPGLCAYNNDWDYVYE